MTEHTFHLAAALIDKGRVVLVGDGAHTMRPTFGQGTALALRDVVMLAGQGPERYAPSPARYGGTVLVLAMGIFGPDARHASCCDIARHRVTTCLRSTVLDPGGIGQPMETARRDDDHVG